jgi:hypothetical protein
MTKKRIEPILLTASQISTLYTNANRDEDERENVEGFENWYIYTDTDTGRYDSGKSSMMDYEIHLYDDKDNLRGTAIGGYYNGGCGEKFNYDLEFIPPKQKTQTSKEEKLNDFLMDILDDEKITLKKKINKIKKYLDKLENA